VKLIFVAGAGLGEGFALKDFCSPSIPTSVDNPFLVCEFVVNQRCVTEDYRQKIVEIVGDAAGQSSNRFHFLCLPETSASPCC
jgi:hypothetical protein